MALDRLLAQMTTQGIEPRLEALARWTETPTGTAWDPEPDYGAFVDDQGRVISGSQPCRAFLESTDPTALELAPETARALGNNVNVVFLDWGQQDLSWDEIFELWSAWESQDMIADCGTVGIPWSLSTQWVSPGWIAFRGDIDGAPLRTFSQPNAKEPSFLERARQLRAESSTAEEELLPMLPFTLDDLRNKSRRWPQGVL